MPDLDTHGTDCRRPKTDEQDAPIAALSSALPFHAN